MICKRDLPTSAPGGRSMAIKKTALLLDHELVAPGEGAARHDHHHRDDHRGDARGDPGAGPGPPLRAAAPARELPTRVMRAHGAPRRRQRAGRSYLATSDVGAPRRRRAPARRPAVAATCGIVDLEVLRQRSRRRRARRGAGSSGQLLPRVPVDDAVLDRAIEVQGELAAAGRHRAVDQRSDRRRGGRAGRARAAPLRRRLRPDRGGHRPADGVGRPAGTVPRRDEGPAAAAGPSCTA